MVAFDPHWICAQMEPITDISDPGITKALAHPVRLQILRLLEHGLASPKELASRLDLPIQNVSYHVRILARLGMIELATQTPRRGAVEHHYRAHPRSPIHRRAWDELPALAKDAATAKNLRRITEAVRRAAESGTLNTERAAIYCETLRLDRQGLDEVTKIIARACAECEAAELRAGRRLGTEDPMALATTVIRMVFSDPDPATQ